MERPLTPYWLDLLFMGLILWGAYLLSLLQ